MNIYGKYFCSGYVFFFKQKTAYEMRISDWSSDVCSSDLNAVVPVTEIMMYDNLTSPDPVKIFGLFHITGGLTRSEVHRYWHGPHAEMVLQLKADTIIRKYSQNHTLLDYVAPDPRYRYDGASIAYFDTVEDAGKIYRNPAVLDVAEADELLMGTEPAAVVSIAVREEIVFDRNGSHST